MKIRRFGGTQNFKFEHCEEKPMVEMSDGNKELIKDAAKRLTGFKKREYQAFIALKTGNIAGAPTRLTSTTSKSMSSGG